MVWGCAVVERQEVEALLEGTAEENGRADRHVPPATLAALCRAWLALDGGDSGWVCGGDLSSGTKAVKLDQWPTQVVVGRSQRVRIVPVEGDQ